MTDTSNKRFVISLTTKLGRTVQLSVPRACANKTADEVRATMDAIIDNGGILFANRGRPITIKSAKRIESERNEIL
jgi:hypothetical protein